MNELDGKLAVITGGARGFGKAFGAALSARGAAVALIDLDAPAVNQAAVALGPRVTGYQGDVTDENRINELTAGLARQHGGIDILINNAGLHSEEYSRPSAEMGVAKIRRLFDVNVNGVVVCTLAAAPYMEGCEGASIVNISSSAAYIGGCYGASKLAVCGLTMAFARELAAAGVRVNAIAPGLIHTETIRKELSPETVALVRKTQYLSADGEEQDIVDAMLFLVSSKAKFITGETLRVTGGFAAGA